MSPLAVTSALPRPIFGVFLSKGHIRSFLRQKPLYKYASLVEANKNLNTTIYFFSIEDIRLKKNKIRGTCYSLDKKRWVQREFPFPDILYRRKAWFYTKELRPFRRGLAEYGTKLLNYPLSFNKWDVHKKLNRNRVARPYLPVTISFKNPSDLKEMLDTYSKVYMKAYKAGRGKQVMRVVKLSNGEYEFSYHVNKLVKSKTNTFKSLLNKINSFFYTKEILIQQAIDLMTVDNRSVDLRAEVQRNGKGGIEIIAICARQGKMGSPITTHAKSYRLDKFFREKLKFTDEAITELENKINKFIIDMYEAIEKAYGKSGEIGIDFGLDKHGRLWYIECNSTSAKVSLRNSHGKEGVLKSSRTLLEYATFLFNKNK